MSDETHSLSDAFLEGRPVSESCSHRLPIRFRDDIVDIALQELGRGRSILLVGEQGVGKTAIVAAIEQSIEEDGERSIRAFSTNQVQAGCVWIGEWQSKLDKILKDALRTRTILYFHDVWNLRRAGTGTTVDSGFWDMMEPEVQRDGGIQLIGEVDLEMFESLGKHPQILRPFQVLRIPELTEAQHAEIVTGYAAQRDLQLTPDALKRIFRLNRAFRSGKSGLQPTLETVDALSELLAVRDGGSGVGRPGADEIDEVFAKITGLPETVISPTRIMRTTDIRQWFRDRIIGQDEAIDAVIETIALYKAGMHNPDKPIGTFLFVGPSGVGKTELAKALAQFLFGSEERLLRFDLSEFAHYNSFEMLVGSPDDPKKRARLLEPVRATPFQVILFDELEKGHLNVRDILLQLLDEGTVSPPNGPSVNFRSTIVIVTSNVGAVAAAKRTPGFGNPVDGAFDTDRARQELEVNFRPEFLNRFQHIVQFRPLTKAQALRVAEIELNKILRREGLVNRNMAVDIDPDVLSFAVSVGYDARYGGRALQRVIQKRIVLPLAMTIMERAPVPGSLLRVYMRDDDVAVAILETEETARRREEAKPVRLAGGFKVTQDDVPDRLRKAESQLATLSAAAGEFTMRQAIAKIDAEREDYNFWQDVVVASGRLALQSRYSDYVQRIDRLRDDLHVLTEASAGLDGRDSLHRWAFDYDRWVRRHARVQRQLVVLGEDMDWPALLEFSPVNGKTEDLIFLHRIYADWCAWHGADVDLLCEPLRPVDPILMLVRIPFAYGYLRLENGLHRIRRKDDRTGVVRLKVAPWHEPEEKDKSGITSIVLRNTGLLGGRLRSRVENSGAGVLLQNGKSIFENSDLLDAVVHSLQGAAGGGERVVRRYDLEPFFVRDSLVDSNSGNKKAIGPELFHDLLCARIDEDAVRSDA